MKFAKALRKRARELKSIAKSDSAASSGDSQTPSKSPRAKKSSKDDSSSPSSRGRARFEFTAHRISQCLWASVVSKKEYKPKKKKTKGSVSKSAATSLGKVAQKRSASKKRAKR